MTQCRTILFALAIAAAAKSASAAPAQFALAIGQVAAAVARLGVSVEPADVALLTDVVASSATPALAVRRVEQVGANDFMMRVECSTSEECLPFFVRVQVSDDKATQLKKLASAASTLHGFAASQTGQIVIRNGSSAVLRLDGGHVHIQIPVVCLENGVTGQIIRATDRETHRTYLAQVIESGLLQGSIR